MGESKQERQLLVLVDPTWNFQPDKFNMDNFFEEAKITEESVEVLRQRFYKFCFRDGPIGTSEPYLRLEDFRRLNKHYSLCSATDEAKYFSAMDRRGDKQLSFDDFLHGCSAANPATPHILNSFTGYVRARYIFDFYNVSRSGSLEFEEFVQLIMDARRHLGEGLEAEQKHAVEIAQELGQVSAVTVRVNGLGGPLCDLRASTRWSGNRLRREIARELQVPVQGQKLVVDDRRLEEDDVLENFVEPGAGAVDMAVVLCWEGWPCEPEPQLSDGVRGLERLAHVSFDVFYNALTSEQLRGTSRLFRFQRQILHDRSRKGASSVVAATLAAVGGA